MRRLTASEVNEIAEVFRATLEACTMKTAGAVVQVDNRDVDLYSLSVGAALVCDSGIAYRTSQGWFGTLLWEDNVSSEVIASKLADDPSVRFLYDPTTSSPAGSTEIKNKRGWTKSVLTDGLIQTNSGSFGLLPDSVGDGYVLRINGGFTYLIPPENVFYSQDGKGFYTVDDFVDDVVAKFRFPFFLEIFSNSY